MVVFGFLNLKYLIIRKGALLGVSSLFVDLFVLKIKLSVTLSLIKKSGKNNSPGLRYVVFNKRIKFGISFNREKVYCSLNLFPPTHTSLSLLRMKIFKLPTYI